MVSKIRYRAEGTGDAAAASLYHHDHAPARAADWRLASGASSCFLFFFGVCTLGIVPHGAAWQKRHPWNATEQPAPGKH